LIVEFTGKLQDARTRRFGDVGVTVQRARHSCRRHACALSQIIDIDADPAAFQMPTTRTGVL
jgi:hypothetical protein